MDFQKKVLFLLTKIPPSKVTTYSELARAAGKPKVWRLVGKILSQNKEPDKYPCYKVVRADGSLGGYSRGLEEKIRRLQQDGISVNQKRVKLKRYFYKFK